MKQKRLLSMLVLLAAVVSGAWAQPWTSGDCTVTFSDGVMTVSGTGAMADYEEYNYTPWSSYDVKTIVIESGVTSIGVKALSSCSKLESVSIPASVTSIGNYAFEACGSYATALTVSFAEGSKLLTIGEEAFRSANLKSIDIPNSVTSIGRSAFSSCSNLESVSIPASVTSIGEEAFYNCGMLAKVSIYAPSLTTYGSYAFHENAAGRKIYVLSDAVDTYKAGWSAYAADIEAMPGYTVSLKDGVKDAGKWTVKAGTDGSFQSLPLEGVKAGTKVKLKYDGDRSMLKGVTAVKAVKKAGNAYLKWDNTKKELVATPMPESFTTVTSENTQWSAGTYVVEGQVEINRTIELSGDVNLIIKDDAKLTVYHLYGNSHNLSIYGQAQMTGELDVHYSGGDAINEIPTLEVHSAKVTATSSSDYGAGFGDIGTFNVYGGLVDAKGTAAEGGCGICLSENGSMNIYGGEVKAEGKGNDLDSYGITCAESLATTVKVYGGKLWAGCADNSALDCRGIHLTKDNGFSGKIETSDDNVSWDEYDDVAGRLDTKYVRVGY